MNKRKTFTQQEIEELLRKCSKEDQKTFTLTLKNMERVAGSAYCVFNNEEGKTLFSGCNLIFSKTKNPVVQYNALRLAKYAADISDTKGGNYRLPWEWYLKTLFHQDGRIRMAGAQLLDRYYFGLKCVIFPFNYRRKKEKIASAISEEAGRFVVENYLYLQRLEEKFINEHEEELDFDELPDAAGRMPWSAETNNKLLKSIRMGIETFFLKGPLEELMTLYEYKERKSVEFPEMSIFQRYEKVTKHKQ